MLSGGSGVTGRRRRRSPSACWAFSSGSASSIPHGPVLVVSHGGPLRAALAALAIEHGPIGNCAVFRGSY